MASRDGGTYIGDSDITIPDSSDQIANWDDELRQAKSQTKSTFVNFVGAEVTPTEAELNMLDGIDTGGDTVETRLANKAGIVSGGTDGNLVSRDASGNIQDAGETVNSIITTAAPVGMVSTFYLSSAPSGWVELDGGTMGNAASGAAHASDDYETLFDLIKPGAEIFSNGDTITLPDSRGEFLRGWDNGRGLDAGRALGTVQADELRSHTHTYVYWWYGGVPASPYGESLSGGGTPTGTTSATGGSETRPRNLAFLVCIKA